MDGSPADEAIVLTIALDEERRTLTVDLDDGSSFTVAPDAPEARGLTPGLAVDPETLDALRHAHERKEIARRIFGWLDRRPRSRVDLRRRLRDRGHDDRAIDTVLDQFESQGLVDDRAYAALWVEQQIRRKPVGRTWLCSRLRQQGVDSSIADEAVAGALDPENELELARRALAKRRLALEERAERHRALRFLEQRGFGRAIATRVVREAADGRTNHGEDFEA